MAYADLHLHSNHSDGADAPAEVVARARKLGLAALALTDHDTVSGVAEAAAAAADAGIGFLTGVEISAAFDGIEIHVTGLGMKKHEDRLPSLLERLRTERNLRAERIVARLQAAGIPITLEMARAKAHGDAIGRMHLALVLMDLGITRTAQEGFDRFLNGGLPGWVPKAAATIEEAIETIHAAHGLAFLAHPGLSKNSYKRLDVLLGFPFDGIEAYHISHTPGQEREFLKQAEKRGLLAAGGSDCHGGVKGRLEMGKVHVPLACYDAIVERVHA